MAQDRSSTRQDFEFEAEILVAHQLDLVAQLERQLRAILRTMRQIEQLRSAKRRAGKELSNGDKTTALGHITDEVAQIDTELSTQHESCLEMQRTVETMRAMLRSINSPAHADDTGSPNQSPA
jgi:hypothetical protein